MALSINTNLMSLNAQRNLNATQLSLSKSMERLSSGLRINSAADDVAGLGISVTLDAKVRSYNQAIRNANDGVSNVQTSEGVLSAATNILIRMRELAVQAATGTTKTADATNITKEMDALKNELTRIAVTGATTSFQVGIDNGASTNVIAVTTTTADASTLGVSGVSVASNSGAATALDTIDSALASVSAMRADLGAVQNRLQSTINNLQVAVENTSANLSRIRDVDVAAETANMTRANILVQAGVAVLAQANQAPQAALKLLQ